MLLNQFQFMLAVFENLVTKGWPEFHAKIRNGESVKTSFQGLRYRIKRIANENY